MNKIVFALLLLLLPQCAAAASIYTWTDNTGTLKVWSWIASSNDGLSLVTGDAFSGDVYTSGDGGTTWTDRGRLPSLDYLNYWGVIVSSSDGKKLAATPNTSGSHGLYTSSDGGITWVKQTGPSTGQWPSQTIASSADGNRLATVYLGTAYVSTDAGVTWAAHVIPGAFSLLGVASSADGTHLAVIGNGNNIYTSTDGGTTWTTQTSSGARLWKGIASSADGSHLAATVLNGDIYTSGDGGVTWIDRTASGARPWSRIASSGDGTYLVAAAGSSNTAGDLYTSMDGGATWTDETSAGSHTWTGVSMSYYGNRIAATAATGDIYAAAASSLQCNGTAELYSTPGTYYRSVPSYSSLVVEAWGGGGPGYGSSGSPGAASTFSGLTAGGGGIGGSGGGAGGTASGGDVNTAGGTGGPGGSGEGPNPSLVYGGSSPNGGAGATTAASAGSPPGGAGSGAIRAAFQQQPQPHYIYYDYPGGGGGAYVKKTYSPGALTVGSMVTITVGSGGTSSGGGPGAAGEVKITCSQGPAAPAIAGPTSLAAQTPGTYSFQASDPAGDTVRYGIDWDNDGIVDEWAPALGYVQSGTRSSTTHSWNSAGSVTFQAETQNSHGATSGWTPYSVTVTDPLPVVLLTASPSSIAIGQSSTLTWSSSNADSCSATNFSMQTQSNTPTVIFLTSGTQWTVPSDWNNSANTIEVIGGGGNGSVGGPSYAGTGGGGGAYSKTSNVSLPSGTAVAYAVGGAGGDTYFCNSTLNCGAITDSAVVAGAKGGGAGNSGIAGVGGASASGVGSIKHDGGVGGGGRAGHQVHFQVGTLYFFFSGGGGGAGGPNGDGVAGATASLYAGNGGAGDSGFGGAGGAGATSQGAGTGGSPGTEFDVSHGSGGGGGGAYYQVYNVQSAAGSSAGGSGGSYGAGAGGGQTIPGAPGLIVITYYAVVASSATSGTVSVSPPATTQYTVTCTGPGGQASDSKTVSVGCTDHYYCSGNDLYRESAQCTNTFQQTCSYQCSVGACLAPPPPAYNSGTSDTGLVLTGHLQVAPSLLTSGSTTHVYWNVSNVSSCSVTGSNGDSWSGASSGTSGKLSAAITQQTTYTLSCTGLDGSAINESATVNILPVFKEL